MEKRRTKAREETLLDLDNLPDIFEYLDYRAWLRDIYETGKASEGGFSYRAFCQLVGFSSPNHIKLVIEGERNLGRSSVDRVGRALGLDREERRFFKALVKFDHATLPSEKNEAYKAIASSQYFRDARHINHGMFVYLSHWYYPAIREMAARPDFREDPDWIAQQTVPRIEPEQAREALELLIDLGLLTRNDDGELERGDPNLTTGHEVFSLAVGNYHRQMTGLAMDSIVTVPREQRDISAITICVEAATIDELKQRVHQFREQIAERSDADEAPDVVYQLNIQLFPLSRPSDSDGDPDS